MEEDIKNCSPTFMGHLVYYIYCIGDQKSFSLENYVKDFMPAIY